MPHPVFPPDPSLRARQFDLARENARTRQGRTFDLDRRDSAGGERILYLMVENELLAFEEDRAAVESGLAEVGVRFTTWEPALLPGLFVIRVEDEKAEEALHRLGSHDPAVRSKVALHYVADAQHLGLCPATAPQTVAPGAPITWSKPPLDGDRGDPDDLPLIAVVDGGYDPSVGAPHGFMTGVKGEPERPPAGGNYSGPYHLHGTFIAGVVRATCPQAQVWVSDVINGGVVQEVEIVSDIVAALLRGARIIIVGAVLYTEGGDRKPFAFEWLRDYLKRNEQFSNVVFVSPAGNDNTDRLCYPAAYAWVTGVGSVDPEFTQRSTWSNYGPDNVNVWAPGEDHVNVFVNDDYNVLKRAGATFEPRAFTGLAMWSGTSFATPLVAALIARLMIAEALSAPDALRRLMEMATPGVVPGSAAPAIKPTNVP